MDIFIILFQFQNGSIKRPRIGIIGHPRAKCKRICRRYQKIGVKLRKKPTFEPKESSDSPCFGGHRGPTTLFDDENSD